MKGRDSASTTRNPEQITSTQWEAHCRQCGLCCFEKYTDGNGRHRTTRIACRYLDVVTRQCRVYQKRFTTGEICLKLTPEIVSQADWLPEECAYRILLAAHPDLQLVEEP